LKKILQRIYKTVKLTGFKKVQVNQRKRRENQHIKVQQNLKASHLSVRLADEKIYCLFQRKTNDAPAILGCKNAKLI